MIIKSVRVWLRWLYAWHIVYGKDKAFWALWHVCHTMKRVEGKFESKKKTGSTRNWNGNKDDGQAKIVVNIIKNVQPTVNPPDSICDKCVSIRKSNDMRQWNKNPILTVFRKQKLAWEVIIYTIRIQIHFFFVFVVFFICWALWQKKNGSRRKKRKSKSSARTRQACVSESNWPVWVCVCFFVVSLSFRFLLDLCWSCLSHTHLFISTYQISQIWIVST